MTPEKSGKSHKYLVDTSALYPMLLKEINLDKDTFCISTLTEYEVGNILWKESKRGDLKDLEQIAQIFYETITNLEKYKISSIQEVLTIAINKSLTFYDASYVYIAEINNLILITEDKDLLKKTKNAISVADIK